MKESVAIAKEANRKQESSPTKSDKSIHRVRNEPERQLGSLRSVIDNIRHDGGTLSVDSIATHLSSMHTAERAPALLALQQTHGNQYVQRVVAGIQAKLKVGQLGDIYEQEADRVADAVMRMPEPRVQRQTEEEEVEEELIQTKPLAEQITPLVQKQAEEDEEKKEEEELLQAKGNTAQTFEVTPDLESRIKSIRGSGQPLPESVRTYFEPRFGYDFSPVRVHTDGRVAESARAVNARAFTVGRDVVFGAGQYAPGTQTGQRLLAHELTHVVQQSNMPLFSPLKTTQPSKPAEREAEAVGQAMAQERDLLVPKQLKPAGVIARKPEPTKPAIKLPAKELAVLAGDLGKAHNYVNDYFRKAVFSLIVQAEFYEQLLSEVERKTKKPDAGLEETVIMGILVTVITVVAPEIGPIAAWAAAKGTLGKIIKDLGVKAMALLESTIAKTAVAEKVKNAEDFIAVKKKNIIENLYDGAKRFSAAEGEIDKLINITYDYIKSTETTYTEGDLVAVAEKLGPFPVLKDKEKVRKAFLLAVYTEFVKRFGVVEKELDMFGRLTGFDVIKGVPDAVIDELAKFEIPYATIRTKWGLPVRLIMKTFRR